MVRAFMMAAACAAVLAVSPTAFAQGKFGTADEAKAMLVKTAAALKADKAKTLELINKGEGGFLDRDIYPFCFELSDGKIVAVASKWRNENTLATAGQEPRQIGLAHR